MSFSSVAFSQTPFGASGDVTTFVLGVQGTTALGSVSAIASSAAQNLTGVGATLSIGTVTTTVIKVADDVSATFSVGTVSLTATANPTLSGVTATGSIGTITATGVQFNFEAVKDQFDISRVVYVKAKSTADERTVNVKQEIRLTFVARQSSSDDRTIRIAA
jgi:hypothetical protein|tara:strand:- start:3186 stop:3671 length:486 start_codon:yes stop_codon:yes gene_type:complete